ncbi:DUF6376 family protein [Peribacillus sp. NPDC097197]|uniref:DUF6376 family protein n=1 Tax=Peribacillus sp. NPDC097197 TaxID=3390615 RepID=UPI003D011E1F
MKKILMLCTSLILLTGCSLLGEVNSSLDYADTATGYVGTVKEFANEVPALSKDAVTDKEAMKTLENELQTMKTEIEEFNETEPPQIADGIHDKIVSSNQQLQDGIDLYLKNMEDGTLDPAVLEDSEIMKTIDNITSLTNQIEKLGN